jgi:NADH-quinone oxidoreductase subunit C
MSAKLERLSQTLRDVFGNRIQSLVVDRGEVTIEVPAADYLRVARQLRDHAELRFEQLIDISGSTTQPTVMGRAKVCALPRSRI